ncbi:MAG: DUF1931 family protein [Chlorobi bacterium]|nr:DUF1931 family protein [Chlorobiota bacterium]
MKIAGVKKFEKLFRRAGSMDVDKNDIVRLNDFINRAIYRLLETGMKKAKLNGRDVLWYSDLPITQGLEANIEEFRQYDEELDLSEILETIAGLPPLPLEIGVDIENQLPDIAGGITIALIKSMKIINPKVKNPQTEEWQRVTDVFETLL